MTPRLAAAGIILAAIIVRLPALIERQPLDDEAVYSVVATEIVEGGRPYADAIERKPPLLFWTYAAIFAVAGEYNWPALHAVALAWALLTMAGLYVLGRRLFDRDAGLTAALLYGIFQPWATWKNLAFNGEVLMNLPLVWAYVIAFGRSRTRRRPELVGAGALLAVGFLLKQPAAIAAVPLGVYVLLPAYRETRGLSARDSVAHAVALTAGFAGTLGACAGVLHAQGVLADAYYWTIMNHDVPVFFWSRAAKHTLGFVGTCLPLIVGAAIALGDRPLWVDAPAERMALLGWLFVSAIGTAASGRFYPHYYIQLLPPLVAIAGPAMRALMRRNAVRAWLALTVVVFFAAHVIGLQDEHETEAGQYLAGHSSPGDRIFVWGQAPRIYLDAHRRPASRYIATFPLTGYIFGGPVPGFDTRSRIVPGAWDTLVSDFSAHAPEFIVDVQSGFGQAYRIAEFPTLSRLLDERYRVVARTAEGEIYRRLQPDR